MRLLSSSITFVVATAFLVGIAGAVEEDVICKRCFSTSQGPCQVPETGVCHEFFDMVDGLCAPGTAKCVCPTCTSGFGPCHGDDNPSSCVGYAGVATRTCPDFTFECGAMGIITSPSPSPSFGAPPTQSPTPAPSVDTTPDCQPCAGDSTGPCLGPGNACFDYIPLTNTCPPGSYPCVCPQCPSGSSGPCKSVLQDRACTQYEIPATRTCPLYHFECERPAVLPTPEPPSAPSPSPSPAGECRACFGSSEGPCQTSYGVCYEVNGKGECPIGSGRCTCPTCPRGQETLPCYSLSSGQCLPYADAALRQCPDNSFECGEPSVRISPSPSPSFGAPPTPTPTATASFDPNPDCTPCVGESEGFCQDQFGVCYTAADGITCPGGTKECTCPACVIGRDNPCHNIDNPVVCLAYADDDGQECPVGTFECGRAAGVSVGQNFASPGPAPTCTACYGTSSGVCQADNGVCSEMVGGSCSPGTRQCACPACVSGSGDCRNADGVCRPSSLDANGNEICTGMGFFICGAPSVFLEPSPSPSIGASATPTFTPPPSHGVTPECRPCAGLSEGPCQAYSGTCFARPFEGSACPPGTDECECPVCAFGTSGPCHATDGSRSCVSFIDDNGYCPEGYFECGKPRAGPSPTPSVGGPPEVCMPCFGTSEGPCQAADRTCHYKPALPGGMFGDCPPGTNECTCPPCLFGSGDCRRSDGACFAFANPSEKTCPAGTFACGEPEVRLSPTPSPSIGSTRSPSATPFPSTRPVPYCRPCAPFSSGVCQDVSTVCWDLGHTGVCPPHTFQCECQPCTSGGGPCRSAFLDGSCTPFEDAEERVCPPNYFECGFNLPSPSPSAQPDLGPAPQCTACVGQSFGDCQSEYGVCFDKIAGFCPPGTRECECPACLGGNLFAPCHRSDGVCMDYVPGQPFVCPDGTFECGQPQELVSPSPSPSFGAPPTTTPTATPSPVENPLCQACLPTSEGMCVDSRGVCHDFLMGTTQCPHATRECDCQPCTRGSGPCHGVDDYFLCSEYEDPVEQVCPAGTFTCGGFDPAAGAGGGFGPAPTPLPPQECVPCFGPSSGPCQIPDIGVCFGFLPDGSCPSGSQECFCPACTGGTFGDCHRLSDGMCVNPSTPNGACPKGTYRCGAPGVAISPSPSPSPGQTPTATPSPTPSPDLNPPCRPCFGASSGPCQQDNGVCSDYFPGTTTCAAGTRECTCPSCGGASPCFEESSGQCLGYADISLRICPVNSFECGEPTIRIDPPTNPAQCGPCFSHTSGPCQRGDGLCFELESDGSCPATSAECECPRCLSGFGPCHGQGGTCQEYVAGTTTCPAFTFECGVGASPSSTRGSTTVSTQAEDVCTQCVVGTSGPCMSDNGVCFQYYPATTLCPAGTVKCRSYEVTAPVYDPRCKSCHSGGPSTGFCQGDDKVCWDVIPGTTLCPTGTSLCGVEKEEDAPVVAPEPVTVPVNGDAASVKDASGEEYMVSSTSENTDECVQAWSESNPCSGSSTDPSSACLPVIVSVDGTCGGADGGDARRLQSTVTDIVVEVSDRLVSVLPDVYELTLRSRDSDSDGRRRLSDSGCTSVYHASTKAVYARCPDGEFVLTVSQKEDTTLDSVPAVVVGPASSRDSTTESTDGGDEPVVLGGDGTDADGSGSSGGGKSVSAGAVAVTAIVVGCVTFLGAYLVRRQVYASRQASAGKPAKNQVAPGTPESAASSSSNSSLEDASNAGAVEDPVAAMMAAEADEDEKDVDVRPSAPVEVVTE